MEVAVSHSSFRNIQPHIRFARINGYKSRKSQKWKNQKKKKEKNYLLIENSASSPPLLNFCKILETGCAAPPPPPAAKAPRGKIGLRGFSGGVSPPTTSASSTTTGLLGGIGTIGRRRWTKPWEADNGPAPPPTNSPAAEVGRESGEGLERKERMERCRCIFSRRMARRRRRWCGSNGARGGYLGNLMFYNVRFVGVVSSIGILFRAIWRLGRSGKRKVRGSFVNIYPGA